MTVHGNTKEIYDITSFEKIIAFNMIKLSAESCTECGSVLRGTEKFCASCGNRVSADDTSDEIILDMTLPISLEYTEAIKINIDNPSAVKISKADLEFYPYYVIEYEIDLQRIDPSGKKHNLQNHEIVIVDASNAELLSDTKRTIEFVSSILFPQQTKRI